MHFGNRPPNLTSFPQAAVLGETVPQGLKPDGFCGFAARLKLGPDTKPESPQGVKPCPFKTAGYVR